MSRSLNELSRRERQIMDIIYREGEAAAADIRANLPDRLTDSGVRTLLRVLVKKGYLTIKEQGLRYVYYPTIGPEKAQRSALKHLKQTFFGNSAERVMTALLKSDEFTEEDLETFAALIDKARTEGK